MTSCTSCGHESESTARFCSECGLPLVSPKAIGAEVLTRTGEKSHWLTSATDADDSAVRVPGVRRGVKHPLPVVVGAALLAIVTWSLFRAPTTRVQGLAGDLDAVMSSTPTGPAGADVTAPAEDQADDSASTTTATDPDPTTVDVSGLDPALTRYHLFAQHSGRLLRVDLGSGELSSHDVGGRLLGEFGYRLYLVDSDAIFSLPVDDDAEWELVAMPIEKGHDLIAAALTEDGLIHLTTGVLSSAEPDLVMIRIDLTTGSEQRAEMNQYGTFGLVEVAGAGLFELTGDGFRPLADGSVRFHGERLLVIEECEAPGRCRRYWFDRATGQELDRPVPEASSGWLLGPNGRIAVIYGPRGQVFLDTETGETLPNLVGATSDRGFSIPGDLTPDERFLAAVPASDSGDVQIHDLTRAVSWTLDLPRTFNLSRVLLVPKPGGDR